MGGWDVYCAICGSTFKNTLSIDSDDETDATYSGKVIGESDLEWLETLCALGLNTDIPGNRKSFITGQGSYEDYGGIIVNRGKDPNVPIDEGGEVSSLCAYYDHNQEMEDHIVFPFHEVCYKDILLRCFKDEKINEDVLYSLFEEMRQDRSNQLALEYGDPCPPSDQYWECRKGEEVLVTHPVKIPQLAVYLGIIQDILVDEEKKCSESRRIQGSHDIFDKLPYELRQKIFNHLPIASVLALKAASYSMHAYIDGSLKQKLETDMPWLWEVLDIDLFKSQALEAGLSTIIADLDKKSRYKEETADYIPGLVNRRRIWVVCEDIRSLYRDKLAEAEGHQLDSTANLAATRAIFAAFQTENAYP